jgi:large conductance mechanosensitive channel
VALNGVNYATVAEAKAAAAPTINYGVFLNTILEFLIVAFVVFLLVRQINRLKTPAGTGVTPDARDCPFCVSRIPIAATRCPHCTSELMAQTA